MLIVHVLTRLLRVVDLVSPAIEQFFKFPGLALILCGCSVIIPFKVVFAGLQGLMPTADPR